MILTVNKYFFVFIGCIQALISNAQHHSEGRVETIAITKCLSPETFEVSDVKPGEVSIGWKSELGCTYCILYRQPLGKRWFLQTAAHSPVKISGLFGGIYEFAVQAHCGVEKPSNKQVVVLTAVPGVPVRNTPFHEEGQVGDLVADKSDDELIATDFVDRKIETFPEIPKLVVKTLDATRNANDGSIEVNVTDGHGPYLFSIDGKRFQKEPLFKKLRPGNYTVTVKDSKNVTGSIQTVVKNVSNKD